MKIQSPLLSASPLPKRAAAAAPSAAHPTDGFQKSEDSRGLRIGWKAAGLGALALLGAAAAPAQAQVRPTVAPTLVEDAFGRQGTVTADGRIQNAMDWTLATIDARGNVSDVMECPTGHVTSSGEVYKEGELDRVGTVDKDGTVHDGLGYVIGTVHGRNPHRLETSEKGGAALLLLLNDHCAYRP